MPIETRYGPFVPTTNIYDIENLKDININSAEFKDFLVRIRQTINSMSLLLNAKDDGTYTTTEFINGQTFFPDPTLDATTAKVPAPRQVFRKVISFGALPNTATKTAAHGITFPASNTYSFTRIYGTTTDQTAGSYLPIPYASATVANTIELSVDNTNVSITTGIDRTAYTITYVVLEFIKE